MTKKKELKEELLSKVSGGTSETENVTAWATKHSNTISQRYKAAHPEVSEYHANITVMMVITYTKSCSSIQEAKTLIKTRLGIEVDDLD